MANCTKQDLIQQGSCLAGVTQTDARHVLEEFLRVVTEQLQGGSTIEIRGFGTFLTKRRQPRPARNPRTGEVVPLTERTVPLFKFSSDLKLEEPVLEWASQESAA